VKRRLPPDLFPDDLNCLLNICDCSVTVVGDERLPSSSINRALASLVSSHISLSFVAYSPLFSSILLHHGQEQERQKFVAPFRWQAEVRAEPSLGGLRCDPADVDPNGCDPARADPMVASWWSPWSPWSPRWDTLKISLTKKPNLWQDFGNNCKSLGTKLIRSSAYHPRLMVRPKGWIRFLKTC
jgi:hypothetical protein